MMPEKLPAAVSAAGSFLLCELFLTGAAGQKDQQIVPFYFGWILTSFSHIIGAISRISLPIVLLYIFALSLLSGVTSRHFVSVSSKSFSIS